MLACAILLPLVPFHDGYVTVLTRLPGSLPSFIVLLLPAIGLHNLAAVIQTAPDVVVLMVTTFALVGALYGSVKALAQSRVRLLLAYGSFSLFSILWWFVAASRTVTPQAAVFLGAVALVTSGLLLAWQVVRTRYGDDVDPRAISGLASPMPQFAVLFSLLALAAMGLPPFGVFAGFMGLLFASSFTSSAALLVIVIAWLAASWYILETVQRLLFGRQRSDLRYEDLRQSEFASLLIVVLIVIALGVAPANLVRNGVSTAARGSRHGIRHMESIEPSIDIETRRMELRGVIRLAGEVIAQYWPMRTFVHHNPLHSLEYLPFEETVRRGKQFLGGNGYLPSHLYRGYLRSGRIQPRHLDTALIPLVRDQHVAIGSRQVSHGEVLRACLAEGLCTPIEEPLDAQWEHGSSAAAGRIARRASCPRPLLS